MSDRASFALLCALCSNSLTVLQVVNCTGLGSRALFNDQLLYPIRGQILRIRHTGFKPAMYALSRDIPPRTLTPPRSFDDHDPARGVCYVVPRQNDIVIGGTAQANNWDTKISKRDTEEIKRRAVRNFPELANMEVLEVKVGLRPGRSDIRVETEAFDGGKRVRIFLDRCSGISQCSCTDRGAQLWPRRLRVDRSVGVRRDIPQGRTDQPSQLRHGGVPTHQPGCPRCRRAVNCETTRRPCGGPSLGHRCPPNTFP